MGDVNYTPESVELFIKEDGCWKKLGYISELSYIHEEPKNNHKESRARRYRYKIEAYREALLANRIVAVLLIILNFIVVKFTGGDITALIFMSPIIIGLLFSKEGWIIGFSEEEIYSRKEQGHQ